MLLVWLSRDDSVSDPDTWDEVSFIVDLCASTSFFCLGVWVCLRVSLVKSLWIVVKWVSWGCCQTTSGIGGSVKWVASGLSVAAPEWRHGIFSLNSGLQPGYFHLSHFEQLFLGPDFVFPVFSAGEAVYWLHWLYDSISLWNGLSYHMSHRVGKQFLAFFRLCYCSCCCC